MDYIDYIPNWLHEFLNLELPQQESLDDYLDYILPKVGYMGEDLSEQDFYVETPWLEIRDDDNFHEKILHIFKKDTLAIRSKSEDDGPDYLCFVNGNGYKGKWTYLPKGNMLVMKGTAVTAGGQQYNMDALYRLAFMNDDFFILKKHGNRMPGEKKYFVMGREGVVGGMEWRDTMEYLFDLYRKNAVYILLVSVIVFVGVLVLYFSFA